MTTKVTVTNSGPLAVQLSGGDLLTPTVLLPTAAADVYVTDATPLVVAEAPDVDLGGGHGEDA